MNRQTLRLKLIFFLLLAIIFSGCSIPRPQTDPLLDKKARALSFEIKSLNQDIKTSKGTGWAILETPEKKEKFRMAWAAVFPNKLRITFLMSGIPVETIVSSGKKITFLSHTGQHSKYSYKSSDPDMEKYINVPVKLSQIVLVLLGRIPVGEFNDAYFHSETSSEFLNITLRNKDEREMQYLSLNSKHKLEQISLTDFLGQTIYTMSVGEYKGYGSFQIPGIVEIKDELGRKLTLNITRFIANPLIKEGTFELTEPGS